MLFSTRRDQDADLIRARLRALLADGGSSAGWLPDDPDDPDDPEDEDEWTTPSHRSRRPQAVPDLPAFAEDVDAPIVPGAAPASWSEEEEEPAAGAAAAVGRHRASGPAVRVAPARTTARALWIAAVLAALVVAGVSWLARPGTDPVTTSSSGPAVVAPSGVAEADPASTSAADPVVVVVAVVGQVVRPGLVTLPAGSRVADAVAAAGGLLPEADPAGFNAAAVLSDGEQIAIGVPGAAPVVAGAGPPGSAVGALVDLNTATVAELDGLPGIGPVLAQRIVDHRTQLGLFARVEELDDVSGIGPALYAQLSPLVTV